MSDRTALALVVALAIALSATMGRYLWLLSDADWRCGHLAIGEMTIEEHGRCAELRQ